MYYAFPMIFQRLSFDKRPRLFDNDLIAGMIFVVLIVRLEPVS